MAKNKAYSDQEINDFLEIAQDVGFTKAIQELGYPKSWSTAQRWAELRGVEINTDEIIQRASKAREWYRTQEILMVAQQGIARIYEELSYQGNLTPDDHKKLAEAFQKHYNVWANAQGKANHITESRETDVFDSEYQRLLDQLNTENQAKKESVTEQLSKASCDLLSPRTVRDSAFVQVRGMVDEPCEGGSG